MASKDPAALIYIANWFLLTKNMKADERGWFINLTLHYYDEKSLPSEINELAFLAGVRFEEYESFKNAFKRTFEQLFEQNDKGRLINDSIDQIITGREKFKKQQTNAGQMSYFMRYCRQYLCQDENILQNVKKLLVDGDLDDTSPNALNVLFKLKSKHYIDTINNTDISKISENEIETKLLLSKNVESLKLSFDNDYNIDLLAAQENGFNPAQLQTAKTEFWNGKQFDEEMVLKGYKDVQKNFLNWCRLHRERIKKQNNSSSPGGASDAATNWG